MYAPRVRETTTTTGTGNVTLAGAVTGFQSFNAAFGTSGQVSNGEIPASGMTPSNVLLDSMDF